MMDRSVLIVDDNAEFRGWRGNCSKAPYSVVGEADDAGGALRAHAALRPDIVLLDIQLPDQDGFAVAESLAADADPPIVVLISSRDRAAYRRKLALTTARAFLPKGDSR